MVARIVLRPPAATDAREFVAAVAASKALHRSWVAPPATPEAFRAWRKRMAQPTHRALLVCRRDTGTIVGVYNLSNIVRGPLCSAYLGYYAFAGHERQGLMTEGLKAVLRHAFGRSGCTGWKPTSSRPTLRLSRWCIPAVPAGGLFATLPQDAGRWTLH